MVCGVVVGIILVYNVLIVGVFFIIEIVFGLLVMESFGLVVVVLVVVNIIMCELLGYCVVYEMLYFFEIGGWEVLLFLVFGVLVGILVL